MSKAHGARLAVTILGALSTVFWVRAGGATGVLLCKLLAGFVLTGILAEWSFRRLASTEEIRADLEDRVRSQD